MAQNPIARLAPQLQVFVTNFAATGDGTAAARAAGVHPERAPIWSRSALRDPAIRSAVEYAVRNRFIEAGPIALNQLLKMAKNEGNAFKPDIVLSASKTLLDRAGYTSKDMREADSTPAKDMSELSRDELLAALESTERELANRAHLVEVSPKLDAIPVQVLDLEG